MFLGLFSKSQGPQTIGLLLAIGVVAGFGLRFLSAFDGKGETPQETTRPAPGEEIAANVEEVEKDFRGGLERSGTRNQALRQKTDEVTDHLDAKERQPHDLLQPVREKGNDTRGWERSMDDADELLEKYEEQIRELRRGDTRNPATGDRPASAAEGALSRKMEHDS